METNQNLGNNPNAKVDQVKAQAHDKIEQLSESARPAVDRLNASAHSAVDSLSQTASQAAKTLQEKSERLKEAQARLMDNASTYVQEHPAASIGIAVATGFVLSRLLSSSSSHR